jgi:hypothetical protein
MSDARSGCSWPNTSESISCYCFGNATDEERFRFEEHFIECRTCWAEVQRLDAIIRTIQVNRSLTRRFDPDVVSLIGISSRLSRIFGGHVFHAAAASVIYGLMLAVTVFMEIAYSYDRYRAVAWPTAVLVFCWTIATTLASLAADTRLTRSGSRLGLIASIAIFFAAAVIHYDVARPFLPDQPVTQAIFQTSTAQAAYLKGVIYCGGFTAVFLLLPFHFIVTMQRELVTGRHRAVRELLSGDALAVFPRGAPFLRFWLLPGLLVMGAMYSLASTAHLLEALKATPYTNLFIHTIQIRWALFLLLGAECSWWYYSAGNELKRECRVVTGV